VTFSVRAGNKRRLAGTGSDAPSALLGFAGDAKMNRASELLGILIVRFFLCSN
jgi:hypothetical protein